MCYAMSELLLKARNHMLKHYSSCRWLQCCVSCVVFHCIWATPCQICCIELEGSASEALVHTFVLALLCFFVFVVVFRMSHVIRTRIRMRFCSWKWCDLRKPLTDINQSPIGFLANWTDGLKLQTRWCLHECVVLFLRPSESDVLDSSGPSVRPR